ncbi:MAG: LCP family protein [Alicyclobacillaceae bacterium]|nr:LCP family protein [Alicyclobacillaceae bacterium]
MKKSRMFWLSLLTVLVLGATFGLGYWEGRNARGDLSAQNSGTVPQQDSGPSGPVHVLLLGYDARPGQTTGNSDTLIVASFDPAAKRLGLLSVPRDTRVAIPGHGYQKINAAMSEGGVDLTRRVVGDLLGVSIDYYVRVNFQQFKEVIDTLGGVTVEVDKDMYYVTGDTEDGVINLHKGVQHLNGDQALQFVRYRQDALGDITRTERQQKLLKALADQVLQPSTIVKLPVLIPQVMKAVDTDLSVMDVVKLGKAAAEMDRNQILTETLPGQFLNLEGVSYWQVDPQEAKRVMADLDRGAVAKQFVEGPSGSNGGTSTVEAGSSSSAGRSGENQSGSAVRGTQSGTGRQATATVLGRSVHVRSGPGMNYGIIGSVAGGQTVTLLSPHGAWWLVRTPDGMQGYMSADWLQINP